MALEIMSDEQVEATFGMPQLVPIGGGNLKLSMVGTETI